MRILIADDEPAFRNLLEETLTRWGYEVIVSRDGNEAWQALQGEDAPKLAILDWLMPGLDGVEICRRVRKEVKEPYVYILLLTVQHRDEDIIIGMDAGADDYITKPLKTDELRVRLNAGRRIIELQNELITASEKLARHALDLETTNRDLETFSHTVSNDLLNSVQAIGTYTQVLQEQFCAKENEQCRSYTKRIYDKTRHLGELINIMHKFFRPTRSELKRETIDLSAMAGKAAEKFRMTQPERQVAFRITEGIMGNGDRNLLQVVLENLLNNAWKHTSMCKEAFIEFGATEFEGKPVYFVRDNGIGFDMAHAEKLFMPFQRLPGTEEFAGDGIGLATVERIARRHGGRVWVEGEPGKGATFYFTLQAG